MVLDLLVTGQRRLHSECKGESEMNKKLYGLITTITTSCGTIASAILGYLQPSNYVAIIGTVTIGIGATNDILLLFVKEN